jgi:hypothetical protein
MRLNPQISVTLVLPRRHNNNTNLLHSPPCTHRVHQIYCLSLLQTNRRETSTPFRVHKTIRLVVVATSSPDTVHNTCHQFPTYPNRIHSIPTRSHRLRLVYTRNRFPNLSFHLNTRNRSKLKADTRHLHQTYITFNRQSNTILLPQWRRERRGKHEAMAKLLRVPQMPQSITIQIQTIST